MCKETLLFICNEENAKNSTSGGAFYSLALAFFRLFPNGKVFGSAIDYENKCAYHCEISNIKELEIIQGSKYVQSRLGNTLKEVRSALEKKTPILFIGTPCQVDGLNCFLGRNYDYLYTIDIVCHGVPSPLYFRQCMNYYEELFGGKIEQLKFRNKSKYDRYGYTLSFVINNTFKKIRAEKDPYYRAFLEGTSLRWSCYKCPYTRKKRVGDISLGDSTNSSFHPFEAISLLLINSSKGLYLFEHIDKCDYKITNYENEGVGNRQLLIPTPCPEERKNYYNGLFSKKYCLSNPARIDLESIKYRIRHLVPTKYRYYLKRLLMRN